MKKPLILIVDDTLKNIQLLGTILKKADYEISVASDGKQALKLLETVTPDLILLDIMMPDIDGYEVCQIIKKDKVLRSIPIIFLTGKTDTSDIVKGFEVGAADYVMKPYKTAELMARVQQQLELKYARDELRSSNEELARLNRDKDQFLSIISHDLRSPFQGILGLSGLLKNEFDNFSSEEICNIIDLLDSSLNGVYKLVENLLSWSMVEMGNYKLYALKLNIREVMETQIGLYEIQVKDKNINIVINVEEEMTIITDEQALSTVLRNLISNAVKFTPRGGDIRISAYKKTMGNIEFSVKDTGAGLDKAIIHKIIGREDQRLESKPGTNKEQGSGLGLILSRELIQLMGGQLFIDVEPGKGSNFRFVLPAKMNKSE